MKGRGDAPATLEILSDDEISSVLAGMTDTQHRAIFQILVDTGLSLGEVLGDEELEVKGIFSQDVDLYRMTMKIESRFTADDRFNSRTIPLTSHSAVAIQDFVYSLSRNFKVQYKLFDKISDRRVRQMLNEAGERAGLKKELTPSLCRRTAIVRMLKQRTPPAEVRRRLGFLRPHEENMIVWVLLTPPAPLQNLSYSDDALAVAAGWSGFSAYKPEL